MFQNVKMGKLYNKIISLSLRFLYFQSKNIDGNEWKKSTRINVYPSKIKTPSKNNHLINVR